MIKAESLHHFYPNGYHALRGVNVSIQDGEFVAIIGQNGSGKTTFAKHLNSLLRASRGCVFINGQDVRNRAVSHMAATVGYCFQNPDHQIFCDSVHKEVAFGPQNLKLSQTDVDERVQKSLTAVGLWDFRNNDPLTLSRGQRQRLAVASVLSMRPKILVVDEPTTGQDYRDSVDMLSLMNRLNEGGHTVLLITHDMAMVAHFVRRVVVFHEGKILLDGTPQQVFGQTDTLRSASLTPPQITSLAQAFPKVYQDTILSVSEMVEKTIAIIGKQRRSAEP